MKNNNQPTNEQLFTTAQVVQFLIGAFAFLYFGAHLLIHLNA